MRHRVLPGLLAVIAFAALAHPLAGQSDESRGGATWEVQGLSRSFCVQLLLAPSAEALQSLPAGYRPLPASRVGDLHLSLRDVIQSQPEFASWSPSRLCFDAVDSLRTTQFTLTNRKGKRPYLFATWTVSAADSAGVPHEVALDLLASTSRLVRSARLAGQGQEVHEVRLTVGVVPGEDEDGIRRTDRRFEVKLGKTRLTWDGHPAGDSTVVQGTVERSWVARAVRGEGVATGRVSLKPAFSRAMAGSLKIDGKNDFAKALKASPTRFAGPEYFGGSGTITIGP